MPRIPHSASLPLPRGWPRRVRSAVVQVISLARTSLALTQGWASESLNPELRQRAVEDRLQHEIQLLGEEIRIKDARMEQIETLDGPIIHLLTGWRSSNFALPVVGLSPRPLVFGQPTHHRLLDGASR
jgi:hypothetical protein